MRAREPEARLNSLHCLTQALRLEQVLINTVQLPFLRARQQGTELGVRPRDRGDLMAHLDGALVQAEALQLSFGVASLSRVRAEIGANPV